MPHQSTHSYQRFALLAALLFSHASHLSSVYGNVAAAPSVCPAQQSVFKFELFPGNEVAPFMGAPAGATAEVRLEFRPSPRVENAFIMCVNADFTDFTPVLFHLHNADIHMNGGVIVDLTKFIPKDSDASSFRGCKRIDTLVASAILANPSKYYLNAHAGATPGTDPFLTGIRGQLVQTVTTTLCPTTEIAPFMGVAGASGKGTMKFVDAGTRVCVHVRVMGFDPVLGHLHQGVAGVNGPRVLSYESELKPNLDKFNGCVSLEDPTLAATVLADPSGYYLNIHAGPAPGELGYDFGIRGQLELSYDRHGYAGP